MSLLRGMALVFIGVSVAAMVRGNAAGMLAQSSVAQSGRDTNLRCDPTHLTATWIVSEDAPGILESVLIGNIANTCDGGTLHVFTDVSAGPAVAVPIPVSPSTHIDVPLGLPVSAVNSLSVVILAPKSL